MRTLTPEDANALVAIERACSALSLIGCLFVLLTFSVSDAFRQRAINRMVFYATFGNMLTNVATLMTRNYLDNVDSFGCQFQAFLIQVFMQGDAYWALSMAINVYLTFYHKYDARMLRKMEIPYFLCCYGIPFIPGFTFIFVSREGAGRPYGNAVLWCWLKPEWEIYRIATFYGPVWVAIVIAMTIYIRAGREIFNKRRRMLNFSSTGTGTYVANEPFSPLYNEFSPAFNFKTTEVTQTTEIIQPPAPVAPGGAISSTQAPLKDANVSYSVTISADAQAAHNMNPAMRQSLEDLETLDETTATLHSAPSSSSNNNNNNNNPNNNTCHNTLPGGGGKRTPITSMTRFSATATTTATTGTATLAHTKSKPGTASASGTGTGSATAQQAIDLRTRRRNYYESHHATWHYTKCAILFFSVLLITWIPSSGNRVYSMINGGNVSRPLEFASAFVLPLQGFWNAIIYVTTSWAACRSLWATCSAVMWAWAAWLGDVVGGCCGGAAAAAAARRRRRTSVVEITDVKMGNVRAGRGKPGGGGGAGVVGVMWGGRKERDQEESTSMEDLTAEGRAERVSPV